MKNTKLSKKSNTMMTLIQNSDENVNSEQC